MALESRSKESVAPDYSDCGAPKRSIFRLGLNSTHAPPGAKARGLAVIIPPVKITRTHAGKRFNQVLENEAE